MTGPTPTTAPERLNGEARRHGLRRTLLSAAAIGTIAVTAAGCGGSTSSLNAQQVAGTGSQSATAAQSSSPAAPANAAAQTANVPITLQLDAATGPAGWVTGKKGWPRYVPGDGTVIPADYQGEIKLPANTTVTLTIAAHDDMVTALPDGSPYNKVLGGTETVDGKTVTTVTNADIAHTITVPGLGINIPIPKAPDKGTTTVTFTFKTGAAGTYTWRCLTPCGDGPTGMGGAMATNGWMRGTFVVG